MAAYAMNQLISQLGLANMGERFHGDNPNDWVVVDPTWVRVVKNGLKVADVYFEDGNNVNIIADDVYLLIRHQHSKDFYPPDYGIVIQTARDFKGDKITPDIDATWTLPDDLKLSGPRVYTPPSTLKRKPKVKGSLRLMT